MSTAKGIIAKLTPIIAAYESSVQNHEAAETQKIVMLEGGLIILGNGTSNSAEFNQHLATIDKLYEAHLAAKDNLHRATMEAAPFIRELFKPSHDENKRMALAAALPFCDGKEHLAINHAGEALEVWTLAQVLHATHGDASFATITRARLFIQHLNLWLAEQGEAATAAAN